MVEANRDRRNLVLSRRGVLEREQAEAKEKLLAELEVGQTREGMVRNIRDFGAFVDLGGIDGMIHVSQMSWDRIKHPSEVLTLGQKVKVKIQKIDPETHKISLAYRDLFESPWTNAASKYPVTSKVTGTVSKIMDFGAFVKLEPGVEGLVHISELSYKRVHRVSDIVQEGQQVEAKVLSVDPENQRISLSMKAFEARPESAKKEEPEAEAAPGAAEEEKAAPSIYKAAWVARRRRQVWLEVVNEWQSYVGLSTSNAQKRNLAPGSAGGFFCAVGVQLHFAPRRSRGLVGAF